MANPLKRMLRLIALQGGIQIRLRALSWWSLALMLIQPAVFSAVGFVLASIAGRPAPDLVYTIIGGGVMGLWSSIIFTSFSDVTRDRREGTLELIVGSPTSLEAVLAVRTLANVAAGFFSLLVAFLAAELWFRYPLPPERIPWILAAAAVLAFAFWSMGLFLANFRAWSRVTANAINYLELPVAVLCGFMFPVWVMPGWMQALSAPIPARWAVAALNGALTGAGGSAPFWQAWLLAAGLSAGLWLLARAMAGVIHRRIRIDGGLGMV